MVPKTLTVLGRSGVGKKTITGNFIYKCGLDMMQLAELEHKGVKTYSEITSFYEKNNIDQTFYGPSNRFRVETTTNPDAALWVVDATDPDKGKASSNALVSLTSSNQLQPRELLVIIINKMDLVNWSEQVFRDFVHTFSSVVELMPSSIRLIPVSALDGENILDSPSNFDWVTGVSAASNTERSGIVSNLPLMKTLP